MGYRDQTTESREVGYGIKDVWVDPREAIEEVAPMTLKEVNARVADLTAVQEQTAQDIGSVFPRGNGERSIKVSYMTLQRFMALLRRDGSSSIEFHSQLQAADRKSHVGRLYIMLYKQTYQGRSMIKALE
ncbi:hypothetical protein Tco_0151100 [Tanacetum coccineum]